MMKKVALSLAAAAAGFAAMPAQAAVVFSDNFDGYTSQLGWTGGGSWSSSSVDLVTSGTFSLTCAGGSGNCVDLTGSAPGTISQSINLAAGSYTLSFDYTGNQLDAFGGPWPMSGFTASIGGNTFAIGPLLNNSSAFTNFTSNAFTLTGPATLVFAQNAGGDQYRGSILDNVSISTAGAVPEPATWLTMILGFGLIGGAIRQTRRRQRFALAA